MNDGWFKIHRCLFRKAIWLNSTPEQKVILITLLGMANHEGKEWEWNGIQFKAQAGQFITSVNSIISKAGTGISRQNVRTALTKFKKYDFLTYESTKTGIFVSIINWGLYQGEKITVNQPINQRVTKRSPTPNQPLTTNNNDKNNKNVKKDKKYIYISEFTQNKLLIQTIIDFMKMRAEIKRPMTDRAVQLMLTKLKGLSQNEEIQIKILENSIENCWQGIFPLKDCNNGRFQVEDGNKNIFKIEEGNNRIFKPDEDNNRIFKIEEDSNRIFKPDENNNRIFQVGEYDRQVFLSKGDRYGGFKQNNGASEKKFNIKIPVWQPSGDGKYTEDEPF